MRYVHSVGTTVVCLIELTTQSHNTRCDDFLYHLMMIRCIHPPAITIPDFRQTRSITIKHTPRCKTAHLYIPASSILTPDRL